MNRFTLLSLSLLAVSTASAQTIRPRPLGAVQSTSNELFGTVPLARALPNGSVIVNDVQRRRLLLLDPSLQNVTVIADSTSGALNGYGQRPGALIPYVGDSTLFLDVLASSFLVIDPSGKVTRTMSPPRPNDNGAIAGIVNGFPGFDAKGRMVYRTNYPIVPGQARDGSLQMPVRPDSAPLLRVDLDTRRADTIAAVRTAKFISNTITLPSGGTSMMQTQVPLATIDDWAVLSDGTIAIVRGADYKVDFLLPDGSKRTSPKIAFDWRRLDDEAKLFLIDSIVKARAAGPQGPGGGPMTIMSGGPVMVMGGGGGGGRGEVERMAVASGVAMSAGGPGGPGGITLPAPVAADLPDYMPAFTSTSARPDADGNLWIRTSTPGSEPGNFVYDVINNQGNLVDRVDVPKGMTIIGFGKGGAVYLSQREGYGVRVLKASIK
jgi:hypothetical protein